MTHLDRLERYLQAQMNLYRAPGTFDETGAPPVAPPFVTISRQAGAGGHSVAEAMLDEFGRQPEQDLFGGWQVFDQKLCEIVASDPAYSDSLEALLAEDYKRPAADMIQSVLRSSLDQDFVMAKVFRTVRALAAIGKAIIVGRAGAHVTADMHAGIHFRIVAPEDQRIERVMEVYELDRRKARSYTHQLDTNRARLIKTHFGVDIDDPDHYDAVWNTGSASIEDIATATAALAQARIAALQPGLATSPPEREEVVSARLPN